MSKLNLYVLENKDKVEWFDDLAELFKNDDKVRPKHIKYNY